MTDQDIPVESANPPRQLPGRVLRQARETQGLTLSEVAGTLKFSTRQIEALENDDFQQLQGKTFLRGFIRAYARLLKLHPDTLLDMLEVESLPSPEQIIAPANMGETDKVPFYRQHGKKLGLAILVLTLSGAAIFLFPAMEPAVEHHVQSVDVPIAVEAVTPHDPGSNVAQSVTAALSGTAQQQTEAPATLTFEFSDRSWLEVKDANGQTLVTGEFPGGQTQTITGKPPYQLWVGKVSAVKVSYGGRIVDLQPYAREDVARMTVE